MVNPIDIEIAGWDISGLNLYDACRRAKVLEPSLIEQLKEQLQAINPLPAALTPEFIASNQTDRADNVFQGTNSEIVAKLRSDIREMKAKTEKVILLWTANTEQYLLPEIETVEDLKRRINGDAHLPSSILYCVAAIEENIIYLNGSP